MSGEGGGGDRDERGGEEEKKKREREVGKRQKEGELCVLGVGSAQ